MTEPTNFDKRVQLGLQLPDEKKFYFNGYTITLSPQDVVIVLQNNDQPVAFLNTSHTIAKTMVEALSKLLDDFEKASKHEILTLGEYEERLKNVDTK